MNYYRRCNQGQVKAKVYIFDNSAHKLVAEEEHTFDSVEAMSKWADKRNAREQRHDRRIRVVWMQSLTCGGSIHY